MTPRFKTTKHNNGTVNQIQNESMEDEVKIEEKETVDIPRESICEPVGRTEQFELDPSNPGKLITIGSGLESTVKQELMDLIRSMQTSLLGPQNICPVS